MRTKPGRKWENYLIIFVDKYLRFYEFEYITNRGERKTLARGTFGKTNRRRGTHRARFGERRR